MTAPTHPVYKLVLEALPSEQPADYRVRRLLKIALRRFGLRCRHLELVVRAGESEA